MTFRTIKPAQVSLMFRTIERNRRTYGCLSVLVMTNGFAEASICSEPSLWTTLAQHAPQFMEAGIVKSRPEYLVFGHAHGYDGLAEGIAGVRFAGKTKWLKCFGERRFPDAMEAKSLIKVPLDWRYAFGGAGHAKNPAGAGSDKTEQGQIILPALELPDSPWNRRGDVEPAGFGPLDITHPDRQKLVGTYDDNWLKTDFPGMARDASWNFFQAASTDQQFDGDLQGNEPFDLMGMHPSERVQRGRLPGIRPRLLVERAQGDRKVVKEVDCKLRTVVFLPELNKLVQIWQGLTQVADEDATEITHVIAGLEAIDKPRPPSYYVDIFAKRMDERDGLLAALQDEELLPEGMGFEGLLPGDLDLNKPKPADSLSARLDRKNRKRIEAVRAEVVALGLDPDVHAPALPGPPEVLPPLNKLGEYFREVEARGQAQMAEAKKLQQKMLDDTAAEFAERGESFDHILAEISAVPTGPPKPEAANRLEGLRKTQHELGLQSVRIDEIEEMLVDTKLHEQWNRLDQSRQQMYEKSSHLQSPAPQSTGRIAKRQKSWVARCLAERQPLRGYDLTGADLREFDLSGANLDGALMEGACFDGVNLSGASAVATVLAHASLRHARADHCNFSKANLGKASFASASACDADFAGSILWETDFTDAVLCRSRMVDVESLYIRLSGADLSDSILDDFMFYQSDLSRTKFDRTSMNGAYFIETKFEATRFAGAKLNRAAFLKPSGANLCFDGADLTSAVFVQEPHLPGVSMRDAVLRKVFARGADFVGADFSRADVTGAEFGHSNFERATLRGVRAIETGFRFTNLSDANLTESDLRGALLANARMHGARFDSSSLYMADLSRIQISHETGFDRANLGRARLFPRWEPPQS